MTTHSQAAAWFTSNIFLPHTVSGLLYHESWLLKRADPHDAFGAAGSLVCWPRSAQVDVRK